MGMTPSWSDAITTRGLNEPASLQLLSFAKKRVAPRTDLLGDTLSHVMV